MKANVLAQANAIRIETMFIWHQLHWTGHIITTGSQNRSYSLNSPMVAALKEGQSDEMQY